MKRNKLKAALIAASLEMHKWSCERILPSSKEIAKNAERVADTVIGELQDDESEIENESENP